MAEEHRFLARIQSCESIFFIGGAIACLLFFPNVLVVVGAMIFTKGVCTVFFVIPRLIQRAGIKWQKFILFSLFEPALLALATGLVCYWQYYFLRGKIHEIFLLLAAGVSGVLIYFPALYFMMFDHAEKIRTKRIIKKVASILKVR